MSKPKRRECVRDALKCDRLKDQLLNVICVDDKCEPDDYSDRDLVSEAMYMLSLYFENGTLSRYEYLGEEGPEAKKQARKEVRQLKRFISKWKPTLKREPSKLGCSKPELKQD
mgnify:CR=1 FL=1